MDDAILLHIDIHQYYTINEYYINTFITLVDSVPEACTGSADTGLSSADGVQRAHGPYALQL